MTTVVNFIVPGVAVAKGRARFARRGAFVTTYTPEQTVVYENLVKIKAHEAMDGRPPIEGAVTCLIEIIIVPPASWSMKKQHLALNGKIHPTTKPDIDNVKKTLFDGMNNIVFKDDKQICTSTGSKRYGITAMVSVTVIEYDDE